MRLMSEGDAEMTDEQLVNWKDRINKMDQYEMADLRRHAPVGHPVFRSDLPLNELFEKRFQGLGGMTAAISKEIGW